MMMLSKKLKGFLYYMWVLEPEYLVTQTYLMQIIRGLLKAFVKNDGA
jgi:hypothetical protein